MNLPLLCQKNFSFKADFTSLEQSITNIVSLAKSDFTDDIYALLWESGSNILEHGIFSTNKQSQLLKPAILECQIKPVSLLEPYVEISFMYHIPFYFANKKLIMFQSVIEFNGLGNKVIVHIAQKICYDMPKLFMLSALKRMLCLRFKGECFDNDFYKTRCVYYSLGGQNQNL